MTCSSREIILTSSSDSPVTAYDPLTANTLARFSGSRSPRQGLALAGKNLIAASHICPNTASTGFINLYNWWSSASFQCIHAPEPVAPIVAIPDGSYLFSGSLSGFIYTFSLPSGELYRSSQAHTRPISCLVINEDSSLLISGGDDGVIAAFSILNLLDVSSDEHGTSQIALYRFSAHSSAVTGISLGLGGCNASMVSTSLDGTCKFWSIADGAQLQTIQFQCPLWCVAVDPYNLAYVGGSDGQVHAISIKNRRRRQGIQVESWEAESNIAVVALAMVNGNKNLVSASEEGIIRIRDLESRSIVQVFGHERGGTISHLLVTNGFGNGRTKDEGVIRNGISSQGFSEKEISRKVINVEEMEEWLGVAVKDRRRAIDMLEVAIETYEKLLGLLLKEAKGGGDKEESTDMDSSM
ncbi:uncharacterized protein A4U43_C05F22210 [Asparagus officinalis]|uniref:Uncharacterized protein n=1 Tax=Asparagus officinalis TaxID=4686 RepID=A0A5P1ETT2_ASPOF|nr:protein ROOT INITIATION DEFECTIVE 3-like [Asparagus officinalis]ONK69376.1 uncharacterized protein A4U43_C05F22210 [Asparagus officinalis]